MWSLRRDKLEIPAPEQCLPGRAIRIPVPEKHFVNGHRLEAPYPAGLRPACRRDAGAPIPPHSQPLGMLR